MPVVIVVASSAVLAGGTHHVRKLKTRFFSLFQIDRILLANEFIYSIVKRGGEWTKLHVCMRDDAMQHSTTAAAEKMVNAFLGIIKLQTADFIAIENKLCIGRTMPLKKTSLEP